MGESALLDKVSGRVYWESGNDVLSSSSSLYQSYIPKLIESLGLHHTISMICSVVLWTILIGIVSKFMKLLYTHILDSITSHVSTTSTSTVANIVNVVTETVAETITETVAAAAAATATTTTTGASQVGNELSTSLSPLSSILSLVTKIFIKVLSLFISVCGIIEDAIVPQLQQKENQWFLRMVVLVYLIESYYCPTRQYLANAIVVSTTTPNGNSEQDGIVGDHPTNSSSTCNNPDVVEDYLNHLRRQLPTVHWNVVTYHYEQRQWLKYVSLLYWKHKLLKLTGTIVNVVNNDDNDEEGSLEMMMTPSSSMLPFVTKKVITNQATETFQYKR